MWQRFKQDESGAIIIVMAFCITILLMLGGMSIDLGRAYYTQTVMQNAADAGTAACVIDYMNTQDPTTAMDNAHAYYGNNIPANMLNGGLSGNAKAIPEVKFDLANKECAIKNEASVPTTLTRVGSKIEKLDINADAKARIAERKVVAEIFFILDASGSMESNGGFDDMKAGVEAGSTILFDKIKPASNGMKRVAVGFLTYDSHIKEYQPLVTKDKEPEYMQHLAGITPGGRTNIAGPTEVAAEEVANYNELEKQGIKQSIEFGILMTDGLHNNYYGDDVREKSSEAQSQVLTACNAFKNGARANNKRILITLGFTKVAESDVLRSCASRPDLYFYAKNQEELKKSFTEIAESIVKIMQTIRITN
jgi:uncharacterized protein YegL